MNIPTARRPGNRMPARYLFLVVLAMGVLPGADLTFQSRYMKVEFASDQPAFQSFSLDSLGKGKLKVNLMRPPATGLPGLEARRVGPAVEYGDAKAPSWRIEFNDRRLKVQSNYSPTAPAPPLRLEFDQRLCHVTLLGHMNQDGSVRLPALMHLPDYGTFRLSVTGAKTVALPYDASRAKGDNWVRISFPAATAVSPRIEYTWDVVAIHPGPPSLEKDPRFDGYRRNFLTIFQLNPRVRALANHAASDACPLTLYEYAEMARFTPPLAEDLRATDLVRATLDRYLGGMLGYGQRGYRNATPETDAYPHDSLDTYPSLVWSAAAYVETTKDSAWLHQHYTGIKAWADRILSDDRDGDGLIESPLSGNAGSWTPRVTLRPSNWWDTVGFGHKDAYSNAIAFRALEGMAGLARTAGRAGEAARYAQAAQRIKAAFPKTFYNPATGVLAGWKSADGKLHDYYFTFVAGLAATMGLVPEDMANRVMDRMFAKMREVGYTNFRLGLPGNLIPIRREDYVDHAQWAGGSTKADGSDGFQYYENGGATACHLYWTIQGLYNLNRRADAERILFPVLGAFEDGDFQGLGANGKSKDWKRWDGTPGGYEGLLVDNFLTLLAVHTGYARK